MKKNKPYIFIVLSILLAVVCIAAISLGAVSITTYDMWLSLKHWMAGKPPANIYEAVFLQIRLPRVLLCMITGAILAVSGVLMQGLFRNPIVEPGLLGTSAGAAFGASLVFVLSAAMNKELLLFAGNFLVPVFAFFGALLATAVVYFLGKGSNKISVTALLLVGIAINALGLSGIGFLSYIARDPQARSITFWNLGTFSGATWLQVAITAAVASIVFIRSLTYAKQLNVMVLGEEDAQYAGVDTEKVKRNIMLYNTAMVAVATSFVGVISFMGLIIPHVMRLTIGSDHKQLIPASMLAGALLLTLADLGARLFFAPAELPIGIITAVIGAPVFILLLKRTHLIATKGGGYD